MATPLPSRLNAVLNGLVGDKLESQNNRLAIKMAFRENGKDVAVQDLDLREHDWVIYVHGLMADEAIWNGFAPKLGKRYSILHLRYNTGRHISENGKSLSELMEELVRRRSPRKIILIGHSMGGLVIRSACHYGKLARCAWVGKVKTIFLIAVPNYGAALEQIGHISTIALKAIAGFYVGHIGALIEQRSNGIKDLRHGAMVDEDWKYGEPAIFSYDKHTPVPPLPGVHYHILVGNLSKEEDSLMAKYFGDGLVTPASAIAETLLRVSTVKIFPQTGHNSILRSRKVHNYVQKQIL
ncbi:MAG: alpha/beta fold hydrolase [Bdellovibrionaceae bacterium]|nr:alpha/beta fold hydrolase [Bdellovibrionales bacterium]MCB9253169.1 alpha/beta fold hydrolase [Pseudobdellovibrionaceae bacterium]